MRKLCSLLIVAAFYAIPSSAQVFEPLIPVETIDLPTFQKVRIPIISVSI